jgi:hypothetical protein
MTNWSAPDDPFRFASVEESSITLADFHEIVAFIGAKQAEAMRAKVVPKPKTPTDRPMFAKP